MMTLEAFVMVFLAAAAVIVAFTKCKCPAPVDEHRIAWLPTSLDEIQAEEEASSLPLRS
jgi:hypothetical protein